MACSRCEVFSLGWGTYRPFLRGHFTGSRWPMARSIACPSRGCGRHSAQQALCMRMASPISSTRWAARRQRSACLIMKDSRLGVFGALALGISIAIKVLALSALSPLVAASALIGSHAGGRLAAVLAIAILPYAGNVEAARVKPLTGGLTSTGTLMAMAFGLLPSLLLPTTAAAIACTAGAAAAAFIAWRAHALLGGHTGDVLGAVEQAYEIAFLLGVAACVSS